MGQSTGLKLNPFLLMGSERSCPLHSSVLRRPQREQSPCNDPWAVASPFAKIITRSDGREDRLDLPIAIPNSRFASERRHMAPGCARAQGERSALPQNHNTRPMEWWGTGCDVGSRTHLSSHIGLDLGTLLLLALEDGRAVAGDVLEALHNLCVLPGNKQMAARVRGAGGGRHGRGGGRVWGSLYAMRTDESEERRVGERGR